MTTEKKFITDDMEIIGIFKGFASTKDKLWAWQGKPNSKGERTVHFVLIRKVDPLKKVIEIVPKSAEGFRFKKDDDIFIFSADDGIALKTPIRSFDKEFLTIVLPERLNILSKEFLEKIELVEKDNEEANAHKREAQRKKARSGQMVGVHKVDDQGNILRSDFYSLIDISAGGMGFQIEDPAEFVKGEHVVAYNVDGKELNPPLKGTVMAVRQMEEEVLDLFKVGIKFG